MFTFLTVDEVIEKRILPYSKRYLYNLMSRGKIPYSKPTGGRAVFNLADIENFLNMNRKSADYEVEAQADQIIYPGRPIEQ